MPRMPDLPGEHVARSYPFEYTSIDYFCPLYVKNLIHGTDQSSKQTERKVQVCLLTCFTVWVIHLELVQDMSDEESLVGLHRFIALCGTPQQIMHSSLRLQEQYLKGFGEMY